MATDKQREVHNLDLCVVISNCLTLLVRLNQEAPNSWAM